MKEWTGTERRGRGERRARSDASGLGSCQHCSREAAFLEYEDGQSGVGYCMVHGWRSDLFGRALRRLFLAILVALGALRFVRYLLWELP